MRLYKKLILLCLLPILLVLNFSTHEYIDHVDIVLIDSGLSSTRVESLPSNWDVVHYSKKQNDNYHADAVVSVLESSINSNVNIVIHDIVVSNDDNITTGDLIQSLNMAYNLNSDVINLSAGVNRSSEELFNIIADIHESDIPIVAAGGNNYGLSAQYPARYKEVISVGSLDENGDISDFSASKYVDVYESGYFENFTGTSFSTPRVTAKIVNELSKK